MQEKTDKTIDLVQIIDEGAWSRYQKQILGLLALVFAVDGLANQSLGVTLPALIADWGGAKSDFAPVAAANFIGIATGLVVGGMIGDRFGRRRGLIASVMLFGAMTLACMLTEGIPSLMFFRLLDGIGIGGATCNGAAMIVEITPKRHRGKAIAFTMVFLPIGGMLAGLIGATLLPTLGWRAMFAAAGLLPLLLAGVFIAKIPESPSSLIRRSDDDELLRKLLAKFGAEIPAGTTVTTQIATQNKIPFVTLFMAGRGLNTLLLWGGFFTCLMATHSMSSWVPTVLTTMNFGIIAASTGVTLFSFGSVIGSITSGVLVDRLGYRIAHTILCASGVFMSVALTLLIGRDALPPIGVFLFVLSVGFFTAGIHNSLYTLAATLYPANIRGTGVGSAAAFGRLGAVLSSYSGVMSLEHGGPQGFFGLIALLLGLCLMTSFAKA